VDLQIARRFGWTSAMSGALPRAGRVVPLIALLARSAGDPVAAVASVTPFVDVAVAVVVQIVAGLGRAGMDRIVVVVAVALGGRETVAVAVVRRIDGADDHGVGRGHAVGLAVERSDRHLPQLAGRGHPLADELTVPRRIPVAVPGQLVGHLVALGVPRHADHLGDERLALHWVCGPYRDLRRSRRSVAGRRRGLERVSILRATADCSQRGDQAQALAMAPKHDALPPAAEGNTIGARSVRAHRRRRPDLRRRRRTNKPS